MKLKLDDIIAAFILGFVLGFICCYFSLSSEVGVGFIESQGAGLPLSSSPNRSFITETCPYLIIDKVKELQALVGCEKIDAKIGSETTRLVNAAVKNEERELFNQYAAVYMTPSGAPKTDTKKP